MTDGQTKTVEGLTVFVCGPKSPHKCDSDGPMIYGGDEVPITTDRSKAGKGYSWGSVTCSVCGLDAMTEALWRGP